MKKITSLLCMLFGVLMIQAQDNCATALAANIGSTTTVAAIDGTVPTVICDAAIGGNSGDTPEDDFSDHGEWYTYTAGVDGYAVITTVLAQNSGGDTNVFVYSGSCGTLQCITENDDVDVDSSNYLSEVTIKASFGTTYYIAFDNRWSSSGFDFLITETAFSCVDEVLPYTEEFDNTGQTVACWDFIDNDGDNRNWFFTDSDLTGFDPNPGLASRSWISSADPGGIILTADNWVISKAIILPPSLNYKLEWKARATVGFPENYTVYVATGNTINDFKTNPSSVSSNYSTGTGAFVDEELDISSLAGNTVYIAFNHLDTNKDQLNIDAVQILEGTFSANDFETVKLKHYYNNNSKQFTLKASNGNLKNLKLFSILGQEVYHAKFNNSKKEIVDLSVITDGVYIAKVELNEGKTKTIKFIKH